MKQEITELLKKEYKSDFIPPQAKEFTLNNGIKVIFIQNKKIPAMRVEFLSFAGSRFDPENKKGVAHLTSNLLDKGAGKLNSLELSDELELLGTSHRVESTNDNLFIKFQSLDYNFEKSLELISTIIKQPHLSEEEFKREKAKLLTRLSQRKDKPSTIAAVIANRNINALPNPYSFPISGYENDIEKVSLSDIKTFYQNFVSPENSYIIAAGNSEQGELNNLLEKYLGNWNNKLEKVDLDFSFEYPGNKILLYNKKGSVQSEIIAGHVSPKDDIQSTFDRMILNNLFGGMFSSRLNLNLREKHGYTYGVGSNFKYFERGAHFKISTSVGLENTANAVKEIFSELNRVRVDITDEEVEFSKTSVVRKFPSLFETLSLLTANLVNRVIYNLDENYFNEFIDNVNSVTPERVKLASEKYFHPENTVFVIVGDKDSLMPQLEELGMEILDITEKEEGRIN